MDSGREFDLNIYRRFGVEIEINSFDMRNRPIGYEEGKLPEGIYYVANLVKKTVDDNVNIHKWGHDHNNDMWIIKPDGSCGMEVCTPVLKGWNGIMRMCKVVDAFSQDSNIQSDERCSFHVHVDVSDLNQDQLATLISWWVKTEPVFLDSVPPSRKKNHYCQFLGQLDIFEHIENGFVPSDVLLKKLGKCKYYTLNTFHHFNNKRKTIEFRIMDGGCCLDAYSAKNWVRLILHFIERTLEAGMPVEYEVGNRWSGYCWMDPIDLFSFLGFMPDQKEISPGLKEVRQWFIEKLVKNSKNTGLKGVMSDEGRKISQKQIDELSLLFPKKEQHVDIYDENSRI